MLTAVKVRRARTNPTHAHRFKRSTPDLEFSCSPSYTDHFTSASLSLCARTDHPTPHVSQSLKGASGFGDPTKGGSVSTGREAAPSIFFTACKNEKYHPGSSGGGWKRWFRRLRSSFRPSTLKGAISADSLSGCDILILGAPQQKFSVDEFDALKDWIHAGGSLFLFAHEGGEDFLGTNINYLLEEYGISVNGDSTVRITPGGAYGHPKETLVTDGVLNRAVTRFVEKAATSASGSGSGGRERDEAPSASRNHEVSFSSSSKTSTNTCAFVAPFGATLNVMKPAVPVLSTGKAVFPAQRPVGAVWSGDHRRGEGRGKVAVLGSGQMADDEWLDKEDNAKILDFFLRYLSPNSELKLYTLDSEEPDVGEYENLPNVAALAERPKACLNDARSANGNVSVTQKDFTSLFIDTLFGLDMDLIPDAVALYTELGVFKKPLQLIAPQFITPTPKLHPAVFPPNLRELPPPPLELFDLEEAFVSPQTKLNALLSRCGGGSPDDLQRFIKEGARICGVVADGGEEVEKDGTMSADAALLAVFKKMVTLKTPRSDDFGGEGDDQGADTEA
jgi:intraflagellar transport protein 52